MKLKTTILAAFAALVAAPISAAADVVVGAPADPGTGNCIPFGCTIWGDEYQQVYASTDFPGPITITDLEFYNTQVLGGSPNIGVYTISLSTTSAAVDGLDTADLSLNIGPDNTIVYSDNHLPSLSGGVLRFILSTPFTYNPADGNLLMDVASPENEETDFLRLDARNGTALGLFSRAETPGFGDPASFLGWGLVTGFSTASIPEPSTWAMTLVGFGGLGYAGFRTAGRSMGRRTRGNAAGVVRGA